jgi:hypothetical protein
VINRIFSFVKAHYRSIAKNAHRLVANVEAQNDR